MTSSFFSLLLNDSAKLLLPSQVTVVVPAVDGACKHESHPSSRTLRALTDVSLLFQEGLRDSHTTLKLRFYAGYILAIPSSMIFAFVQELKRKAQGLESAASGRPSNNGLAPRTASTDGETNSTDTPVAGFVGKGPPTTRIEELS